MQANFESTITQLTKRWKEITKGKKPLYVEIMAYWPKGQDGEYRGYIICYANNINHAVTFKNFDEAVEWIASKITAMIENEFYERQEENKENA